MVLDAVEGRWQTADRGSFSEDSMAQLANLSEDDPAKEVPHDDQRQLPAA